MMDIIAASKMVGAIGMIGGGALALNELHVPAAEFEQYLAAEETRYVLELKKEIRQAREALREHPDDEFLDEHYQTLIDALCELRPDDRMCEEEE
jgi:hypothetical protein